jgi:hypothetical protein
MCLSHINLCVFEPNDEIQVGYKVFVRMPEGKYRPEMKCTNLRFELGKAYSAPESGTLFAGLLSTDRGPQYDIGFHIFETLQDAMYWLEGDPQVVCEVHAWDIRAKGRQGICMSAFVAKNMRIVREVG